MTISDNDRLFNILQEQGRVLVTQGQQLARIEQNLADTNGRLFGTNGQPGALGYFGNELRATNEVVVHHTRQLGWVKGAAAILTLLWSGAVAIVAAMVKSHH